MEKDFTGYIGLLNKYKEISNNLDKVYQTGLSLCFAGGHGVGKTMATTCILKKACLKNYKCLYSTLSDIVNVLTIAPNDEKYIARRELTICDFLVIDEFDSRFIQSENAADLFGRTLENIFRTRTQNKLPTFMCSNSPNPIETFNGTIKQSIESLMSRVRLFPVLGNDYRKVQK